MSGTLTLFHTTGSVSKRSYPKGRVFCKLNAPAQLLILHQFHVCSKVRQDRQGQALLRHCQSGPATGETALFPDAVGLLASILEEDDKGSLTTEKATTAARMALRSLGNASVQMARERRKRAIVEMNKN